MKKGFFEGWYFKMQKREHVLAAIPGYCRNRDGEHAFLQIILDNQTFYYEFPITSFSFLQHPFEVVVDKCFFGKRGASFYLDRDDLHLHGEVHFGTLCELDASRFSPTIMGPFSFLPGMQCRHGVLSMGHLLRGGVTANGVHYDFSGGTGYIETDAGRSFPDSWLWAQCNGFDADCRMMLAAAEIPMPGFRFQGLIGAVITGGREYRIATYNGGRLMLARHRDTESEVVAAKGRLQLSLRVSHPQGLPLLAPESGVMSRPMRESPACRMHLLLRDGERTIVEATGVNAGFEWQMEADFERAATKVQPTSAYNESRERNSAAN